MSVSGVSWRAIGRTGTKKEILWPITNLKK